jgi:glycogen debranching enzyme
MFKRISLFLCFLFALSWLFSQTAATHILLLGKGQAWTDPGLEEIQRYYSEKSAYDLNWLDGESVYWQTYALDAYDIIWIHRGDTTAYAAFEEDPAYYNAMLDYVRNGGNILLTQHALSFLNNSGLEPVPVHHRMKQSEDNGYGRMLGFHAFRHHPIFDSLHGGAYIWKPPHDTTVTQCGFFDDQVPENGKVVAVDWDYIFVRENSKLIVEYEVGEGKILGIGAYFNLFTPNLNRLHYDVFYDNVFAYLTEEKADSPEHYWNYSKQQIKPLEFILKHQFIPPMAGDWELNTSPIALTRDQAKNEYCEVAGKRMLVAAYEPSGIFEVWAHPFMAFRDYKVTMYFGNDSMLALSSISPRIEVSPECIIRNYHFDNNATLKEIMLVSPDRPAAVIHYEYEGPEAKLAIQYKSNMRLMWPYSGEILKTLNHGYDPTLNAIEINAPDADLVSMLGANKIPVSHYSGPCRIIEIDFPAGEIVTGEYNPEADTLFEVCAGQLFQLGKEDHFDIVFAAGNEGRDQIIEAYMDAIHDPEEIYRNAVKYYEDLQNEMLSIITPDENFNKGYAWALAATDRFFVETPGLGTSLVAGYNGTDRGWDGGHKVNGRPGYAWYFGRDAVWSAFAVLDYGDYDGVKQVLNMFIKYQDLSGKIFHELSTSGFVHYDAADATPLFIILAGRYLEYSGDIEYIRSIWPAIEKAIKYCQSTDSDGDGLIENTNVGHGWVEGGHLFGSHTSLYLASCWAEALSEAAYMTNVLSIEGSEFNYMKESYLIEERIRNDFFNSSGFMYQGIFKDGSFHKEESILPSIPIYFGQVPAIQAVQMLQAYPTQDFSSDWGVRIVRQSSPHFHPRGYHSGSVWPLFTGWVALAEYEHKRPRQGFSHIKNNLNVYKNFSLGYVEEVLNGKKYAPSGVCPHQCWSETMVLQPIIEGMLGLNPSAIEDELFFTPAIPFEWKSIRVNNIKIGERNVNWEMNREKNQTTYILRGDVAGLNIYFRPIFMPGTLISKVEINNVDVPFLMCTAGQGVTLKIASKLNGDTEIKIRHKKGISLLSPIEIPEEGEQSQGIRIIDTSWENNTYTIETEGAAGKQYELEVISNFGAPQSIDGAILSHEGNLLHILVAIPPSEKVYIRKKITLSFKPGRE